MIPRMPRLDLDDQSWRSRFVLTSDAVTAGERKQLSRLASAGGLERVRQGVYRRTDDPGAPTASSAQVAEARLREAVRAHHLADPRAVFTHASAASLWRLPRLEEWPTRVEVLTSSDDGGRSRGGVTRRRESVPAAIQMVEGIPTTSLTRTAVDLARSDGIASSVAVVDAALRGIRAVDGREFRADKDAMLRLLDLFPGSRGIARARWAIGFADARAERAGESLSRLQIHRLGLEAPDLQALFEDDEGLMEGDFFWESVGVLGEFDGFGKYLLLDPDPARSAVHAVLAEKRREDRLRRIPRVGAVVRWGWSTARDRAALGRLLRDAGVR